MVHFFPNSNVLDKKQHFRIILNQDMERQKDKKFENNPTLVFVKMGFQLKEGDIK